MAIRKIELVTSMKWWVNPLMTIACIAGRMRLMNLSRVAKLSRFIADNGFKFKVK